MMVSFDEFYLALWGRAPFPWQRRLAHRVVEGDLPHGLNLPTSSGKTTVTDIAVWALSQGAAIGRRLVYTVDRRLIVDDVHSHVSTLAMRLAEADSGPLLAVATSLREMGGSSVPLTAVQLRGGLPHDPAWVRSPAQPAVIISTVDQVGSRLLWRGYGVSAGMRPIHAGLLGHDTLFVLDEVHLSHAWSETLSRIARYRQADAFDTPWDAIELTATPRRGGAVFMLDEEDHQHPVLQQRLSAAKPAELHETSQRALVEEAVLHAQRLMDDCAGSGIEAPVVGVVVNTVATARGVFEELRQRAEAVLLTGRVRDADRDCLLQAYLPRMAAGRPADANPEPLYVVATQTIEAGADLDFDALVTEHAPLDALRQRFGRLNRLGRHRSAPAVIVRRKLSQEENAQGVANPAEHIYGDALTASWKWLYQIATKQRKVKVVDFGLEALPVPDDPALLSPATPATVLMPAHVDLLVQTAPAPAADPQVGLYLHGAESPPDVRLIWRADLGEDPAQWPSIVALLPPVSREALEQPAWLVRRWLAGEGVEDLGDVEGQWSGSGRSPSQRPVVGWRDGEWRLLAARDIRPGDTLVIPSSYGGSDEYGWNPQAKPTRDVADDAVSVARKRRVLRLHPSLVGGLRELSNELAQRPADEVLGELLEESPDLARHVGDPHRFRVSAYPDGQGLVLHERTGGLAIDDGADSLSHTVPVSLERHCNGVGAIAADLARRCALPKALQADLGLAGQLHDIGKADPRFQAMLGATETLLAKSAVMDAESRKIARWMAGYPPGQRHEAYSVHMLAAAPGLLEAAHDSELVRFLVGSHHGHGRPWFPVVDDDGTDIDVELHGCRISASGDHGLAHLESDWAELFWRLVERYGWWGLSYLETILRLADHRRSEAEAAGTESEKSTWAA